jgi:molecular chaperone GrpE
MSEPPPPAVAGDAPVRQPPALTPEQVDAVLDDFRAWLSAPPAPPEEAPPEGDAGPDLFTLLEQLTALRHEVNLQTKSSRTQQEQNAAALAQLTRALDALQQAQFAAAQGRDEQLRPLLKTLVELHDALSVASREAERVQGLVLPALQRSAAGPADDFPEPPSPEPPALARWLGVRGPGLSGHRAAVAAWRKREADRVAQSAEAAERVGKLLGSLTAGYSMGLQRVERALRQHGLEPVAAAGRPFDPERMEAVEAVTGSGRPAGEVLDEVRRGYLWNGRVFRFAKVRVAK